MQPQSAKLSQKETLLFLKRWMKNPLRVGAVVPSSNTLMRLVSDHVQVLDDHAVVEFGGGTGRLTRHLLTHVPKDRLFVIELDPELCAYLKETFPDVNVIQGDARDIKSILPEKYRSKVSTVISGMPLSTMPFGLQQQIINASLSVLAKDGDILQYTYHRTSPIPAEQLGLSKKRIAKTFRNVPPATVWRFQKRAA